MSETRPTKTRYLIVAAATLMSFLLYLDRFCVSFAVDYIRQDLGLTQSQMGWFISAFFWSYALAQVPSGWMSDRYGARIMLVIYILTWSLFTGLIGAATTFVMLIGTRLAIGLGQAGAYPTAASVVARWMPISARGTASSIVANGGRIGGALAPVLTAYLIVFFVPFGTPVALETGDLLVPGAIEATLTPMRDSVEPKAPDRIPVRLPSAELKASDSFPVRLTASERVALEPAGDRFRISRQIEALQKLDAPTDPAWYEAALTVVWESLRGLFVDVEIPDHEPARAKSWAVIASVLERRGISEATKIAESRDIEQLKVVLQSLPESEPETVVEVLARFLDTPNLYEADSMKAIGLPGEASALLPELEAGHAELTPDELRRFNRFVLEGVYPKELRKLYGRGWRPIMFIYGTGGIFVAGFFWFFFRNRPELHPWSNEAEHVLILAGREESAKLAARKLGAAPIGPLIRSGNMWCSCVMQWGTNIGWLFLVTWLPRYLLDVHNVPIIERGYMTMTPVLVGMAGMFLGGHLTDRLAQRLGIKWGRRLPIVCSRVTAIFAYVGCIWLTLLPSEHPLNSPWVFTALFTVVAFSTDFGTPSTWAFSQDIGGRHVGSVLGWGNMWGNLGAAVAPQFYNFCLGENPTLREWNIMFGMCAASFALSGVCSLIIDATKPVVVEAELED